MCISSRFYMALYKFKQSGHFPEKLCEMLLLLWLSEHVIGHRKHVNSHFSDMELEATWIGVVSTRIYTVRRKLSITCLVFE